MPDGPLWYVPFEALQVKVDGQLQPLISRFRVRYSPTAGLATAYQEIGHRRGNTAIVAGKFSPKLDEDVLDAAVSGLAQVAAGLRDGEDASARAGPDLRQRDRSPGGAGRPGRGGRDRSLWLVAFAGGARRRTGSAKNGGALIDWFPLPSRGPDEMVLPGFHSASESSLKQVEYVAAPLVEVRRAIEREPAANPSRPATKSSSASAG